MGLKNTVWMGPIPVYTAMIFLIKDFVKKKFFTFVWSKFKKIFMYHATTLDSRTLIIKAEFEDDLIELLSYINKKTKMKKQNLVNQLLDFAKNNYETDKDFKFNRDECYEK